MSEAAAVSLAVGQGWAQAADLGLAFALASLVGLERELRQKSAGLRTHTLVGVGAALFMLVSKYGFSDVLVSGRVVLDPSRVAAQIVSGIGFIGGGLIFVRRDAVRGLTTAATIWLTAAVGAACGAALPLLAVVVTGAHFVVAYLYTPLTRRLPRSGLALSQLRLTYLDGRGVLRRALVACTGRGFGVSTVAVEREHPLDAPEGGPGGGRVVSVILEVAGRGSVTDLAAVLADLDGVLAVTAGDVNEAVE